ncbi:MAG: hypothetical protein ABIV50_15585 [Opitutus sp.]
MPLPRDALMAFKSDTVRGTPGFFRVAQHQNGAWSLLTPDGQPWFARAVNSVQPAVDSPHDPVARLRAWGFNVLGPGSSADLILDGLVFIRTVDFASCGNTIRAEGIRLPDVFDSTWPAKAGTRAADVCASAADQSDLLGWLSDDDLIWGAVTLEDRPSLLQVCLSLEPGFAAYHAAWEFVLARHSGQLSGVAKAWDIPLENKEVIRECTRSDAAIMSGGYRADNQTWIDEVARRYFATTSAAIRAYDQNHLLFGIRDAAGYRRQSGSRASLAQGVEPAVDIAWVHPNVLDANTAGPVFVGEFNWTRQLPATPARSRGVTAVERMLRDGRQRLRALSRHPAVVGYAWDFWGDAPGDLPPFGRGLVHLNDAEAREHTELVTYLNREISRLQRDH